MYFFSEGYITNDNNRLEPVKLFGNILIRRRISKQGIRKQDPRIFSANLVTVYLVDLSIRNP